ncbi:hypothetical protein FPOA_03118 [Fusarium poae]|uniref:Uncharacterized protein n=1 Tax=Fusarium poae TaxID=36050 RepID=A0A1B8B8X6_FUSPO|nr:hypothetical protein FPOA_03118 [Fusarium poae]
MSRGPVPSQLYLLSDLPAIPVGDKVRFLGCVTSYSTSSARLALGHLYPKDSTVTASVDGTLQNTILPVIRSHRTKSRGRWAFKR